MADQPSGLQQFITIVAMLAATMVILLGGAFGFARGLSDARNVNEDQCQAIIQLDRNLRFYEQAIASAKELTPPPALNLEC